MRRSRKFVALSLIAAGTLAAGVAFAAWNASGTGSGTANASKAQPLDVQVGAVDDLYPGKTSTVSITVTNPNPYPVRVDSVLMDGDVSSNPSGCLTGVTFTPPGEGLERDLDAAGGANDAYAFTGYIAMDNTSPDACQEASFTIPVVASGASSAN